MHWPGLLSRGSFFLIVHTVFRSLSSNSVSASLFLFFLTSLSSCFSTFLIQPFYLQFFPSQPEHLSSFLLHSAKPGFLSAILLLLVSLSLCYSHPFLPAFLPAILHLSVSLSVCYSEPLSQPFCLLFSTSQAVFLSVILTLFCQPFCLLFSTFQ